MKKIEKFYHDNGNVKIEYEINEFGEKDGFYKEFHENGQLKVEVTFFNGKQNLGTILSYHDNGSKSRQVTISKNGNLNGIFFQWYDNGNLQTEGYYKEDEIFINKEYNINGTILEKQSIEKQSGIFIEELGLEQISLSDFLGLYDENEITEIEDELSNDGSFSDEYFDFNKDQDSERIECTLKQGSFEIIDAINDMKICKDDPFVMIVKDAWFGDNNEGEEVGYISFEALYDNHPPTLRGGEYEKKYFMNEVELAEFEELSANDSIMYDVKYQDCYFVRKSEYNMKKWTQKWLSEDYGHNKPD